MRVVLLVLAVAALALTACGDPAAGPSSTGCLDDAPIDAGPGSGIERLGIATVCFAAQSDVDDFPLERDEARLGVTVVAEEARTAAPDSFTACAAGVAETAELVDADGEHMWLGVDAHYGARELVPRGLLQLIDGAELRLHQLGGFVPSTSLAITNGAQLVVAVEVTAGITEPFGALVVENAGASGPTGDDGCGSVTPLALRFRDDANAPTAANGEAVALVVGGREFHATNIHSVDHGETNCDDAPSGVEATWIATDGSL